jgi:hypothetical protein
MRVWWGVPMMAAMLLAVGGTAATAQEKTHGCACLHNGTAATINFRYKWGEGQWHSVKLQPRFEDAICWRYDNAQKSSPNLTFQLDVDMTKGAPGRLTPSRACRPRARNATSSAREVTTTSPTGPTPTTASSR